MHKKERLSWKLRANDSGLAALTFVQCFTTFIAVPVVAAHAAGRSLLDACFLASAVICAIAFTERRSLQAALVGFLTAIVIGPSIWNCLISNFGFGTLTPHETISFATFGFNLLITALVARHVFGSGRVTGYRILGAVMIYINTAILFSIAYDILDLIAGGGTLKTGMGDLDINGSGQRIANLSYFSLTTITACGYAILCQSIL